MNINGQQWMVIGAVMMMVVAVIAAIMIVKDPADEAEGDAESPFLLRPAGRFRY
jgi:hypothetical protein